MPKTLIRLLFSFLLSPCLLYAQSVSQIYVSVSGSATGTGSFEQPVNSFTKAIELAAEAAKSNPARVEIIARGGTYYIEKTIEITGNKTYSSTVPLSVHPYKKEIVIIHGGKTVPADMIKPVSDQKYLARFQPLVKNLIRVVDLKSINIDPGKLRPVGFGRPMAPSWMEIFLNGEPGQIARWPNKGTIPIDSVINGGSTDTAKKVTALTNGEAPKAMVAIKPTETNKEIAGVKPVDKTEKKTVVTVTDTTKRGGTFTYNDPRPSNWKEPEKAWLTGFFMWGYADDAVPVKSIDGIRRIITTALPTKYGFGSGKPWRAYYAYNIPEEIDVPGEYYVDTDKGMLYFLPPNNLKSVELSVMEDPMMSVTGTTKVEIKSLQFTCSRGMGLYLEKATGTRINACNFNNLGMMAIYMGRSIEPSKEETTLEAKNVVNPQVKNSIDIINYLYNNTTFDSQAGTDNGIVNTIVSQTGMGGIYMSGGDRLSLTPAHNFVKNCLIHDFNRIEKTYRPGIYVAGVGNSISNCEIYNSPSVAILLHGNNHVIEYNNIHNTTKEVDDMGAVYYGRDPSERGSVIRYNYFHNLGGLNKTMAIYHDDGACGMLVKGNLFYRAGTVAGFIGGGQDNNYINNVFLNTRYAIHIDRRLNNWAKAMLFNNGLFKKRLEAVNYLQPPYSTAYPTLKDYFHEGPDAPQRNKFEKNLMVNLEAPVEGDATLIYFNPDNFETIGDPGFVDYPNLNFKIKRNSIILTKIPQFEPLPLNKIGYRKVE